MTAAATHARRTDGDRAMDTQLRAADPMPHHPGYGETKYLRLHFG
ncbi:hypothetical protein AB0K11_20545 [Mycobacterium sp. NPDC050551]